MKTPTKTLNPAQKAWNTRRARAASLSNSARKAWDTRRAEKAWEFRTRRALRAA